MYIHTLEFRLKIPCLFLHITSQVQALCFWLQETRGVRMMSLSSTDPAPRALILILWHWCTTIFTTTYVWRLFWWTQSCLKTEAEHLYRETRLVVGAARLRSRAKRLRLMMKRSSESRWGLSTERWSRSARREKRSPAVFTDARVWLRRSVQRKAKAFTSSLDRAFPASNSSFWKSISATENMLEYFLNDKL